MDHALFGDGVRFFPSLAIGITERQSILRMNAAIVTKTIVPNYVEKEKGWKNPFVLSEDEIEELE